jgi:hypothetical protein
MDLGYSSVGVNNLGIGVFYERCYKTMTDLHKLWLKLYQAIELMIRYARLTFILIKVGSRIDWINEFLTKSDSVLDYIPDD